MPHSFAPRILSLIIGSICATFSILGASAQSQTANPAFGPVVDFDTDRNLSPEVQARVDKKSGRFENSASAPVAELPPDLELSKQVSHWYVKVPPIPTAESDMVLVGTVVDAKAYITTNGRAVFSEFTFDVAQVLKNSSPQNVSPGNNIIVDRDLANVRFSSGRVQHYGAVGKGAPVAGGQYLLFLRFDKEAGSFEILTGYQLANGKVAALDGKNAFGGSRRPYDDYDGQSASKLLKLVSASTRGRS